MIKQFSILLKSKSLFTIYLYLAITAVHGQSLSSFELNSEWITKIESMVKDQKKVPIQDKKKIIDFFSTYRLQALDHTPYRSSNAYHCPKFWSFRHNSFKRHL